MKKMKKLVAVVLAFSLVCTTSALSTSAVAYSAETNIQTSIDGIDAILASHYFLASQDESESLWSDDLSNVTIVPLYDVTGKISSYYVELTDCAAYAVINNNVENPTAIEFGKGVSPQIHEIISNNENPHIIYNSPFSLYNLTEAMAISLDDTPSIYDNYPDLLEPDSELASEISRQKELVVNSCPVMPLGDGDFGFIDASDMPVAPHRSSTIKGLEGIQWVRAVDMAPYGAKNNCGPTAVANLMLYFINNGYTQLSKGSNIDTFKAVYDLMGDGAKMTIADDASQYVYNCDHNLILRSKTDKSTIMSARKTAVKTAITYDRPCGLLLADHIIGEWHWILAVGYRTYSADNEMYFQIVDGWSSNASRFYKPNSGSTWISMTEYWMD